MLCLNQSLCGIYISQHIPQHIVSNIVATHIAAISIGALEVGGVFEFHVNLLVYSIKFGNCQSLEKQTILSGSNLAAVL